MHKTRIHSVRREVGGADEYVIVSIVVYVAGPVNGVAAGLSISGAIQGKSRIPGSREIGQVQRAEGGRIVPSKNDVRSTGQVATKGRALGADNHIRGAVSVNIARGAHRSAGSVVR
jgi:hypothetical protein